MIHIHSMTGAVGVIQSGIWQIVVAILAVVYAEYIVATALCETKL